MWHELVLNGIGGRTIQEAKQNLSFAEAVDWFSYIRKRGSLNLGRRIEVSTALLAFMYNKSKGGRAKLSDFTPHEIEESENDINEVMKMFNAIPNTKRKRHKPKKK